MSLEVAWLTIDCSAPEPIARWWAAALGWDVVYQADDEWIIQRPGGPEGDEMRILFIQVPDEKIAKNRLHLDLRPEDQDAEVLRLEGIGAKRIDIGQGPDVTWVVMADPFGNEFCVLRALRADERG